MIPRTGKVSGPGELRARVTYLKPEAGNAVTVYFELHSPQPLPYVAGQFITLLIPSGGTVFKRAYSFSSSPGEPRLCFTFKPVFWGRVSNLLKNTLEVGSELRFLPPAGEFVLPDRIHAQDHLVFVAGGIGITPIFSMLKFLAEQGHVPRVSLIYLVRSEAEAVFLSELKALFAVQDTWQLFLWDKASRGGRMGRPDLAPLLPPDAQGYWICGPKNLMDMAANLLREKAVSSSRVHQEAFVMLTPNREHQPAHNVLFRYKKWWNRQTLVRVMPDETLLQAAQRAHIPVKSSCETGACGACKVRLSKGMVDMAEPNCLPLEEAEQRIVLSCVSYPTTDAEVDLGKL